MNGFSPEISQKLLICAFRNSLRQEKVLKESISGDKFTIFLVAFEAPQSLVGFNVMQLLFDDRSRW